jgi:hypothetical protein
VPFATERLGLVIGFCCDPERLSDIISVLSIPFDDGGGIDSTDC